MKKDLSDMGSLFELLVTSLDPSGSTWKEKDAFLNCFSESEDLPHASKRGLLLVWVSYNHVADVGKD
ncbi:hypothetical protein ACE6H2_001937 [Prunus campanulata]